MAVFPDRIVLKNSTSSPSTIISEIQTGGSDEITQGELVIGIETGTISLYSKSFDGSIVRFQPGEATGRALVSATAPTVGVNSAPLADGDLWFQTGTNNYYVYYLSAWVQVSGGEGLGDVLTNTGDIAYRDGVGPTRLPIGSAGQVLTANSNSNPEWADVSIGDIGITELTDVNTTITPGFDGYQMNQGSYLNTGEFNTQGSNTLQINKTSANGQGDMPKPDPGDIVYFSTTPGAPWLEMEVASTVGSIGSIAYSIPIVDMTPLTDLLTQGGSDPFYWALATGPTDGQVLVWDSTDGNGNWVPGVAGGTIAIDDLDDVDTTTVAPTDGQALVWDNAAQQWEPGDVASGGGGAVDSVAGKTGVVTLEIADMTDVAKNTSGGGQNPVDRTPQAASNNVSSGNVGTSIISSGYTYWSFGPEGEDAGTVLDFLRNTATFPTDVNINGTDFEVVAVQYNAGTGSGSSLRLEHPSLTNTSQVTGTPWTLQMSTAAAPLPFNDGEILQYKSADSAFKPVSVGIDFLSDVDTSTVAPTDGQVLLWSAANSKWEPASGAGLTEIQEMDDFGLNPGGAAYGQWDFKGTSALPLDDGEWYVNGTVLIRTGPVDSNGVDWTTEMNALGNTGTFWYSTDGVNWSAPTVNDGGFNNLPDFFQFDTPTLNGVNHNGSVYFSFIDPATSPTVPLAEGDLLRWDDTAQEFRPTQAAGLRAILGIEEYADDAAAGTGGLASGELYYNTTSSSYVLKA